MNRPFEICAPPFAIDGESGYAWPTPEQQWMLRAALLPVPHGIEAWEKWRSLADIDHLDYGSFRLIPLLYRNLKSIGVETDLLGRFKGIYRRAWYQNQLALHRLSAVLRSFHEMGIPTLILKGAALAHLYYRDLGLRPMADIDVLIPTNKAIEALQRLIQSGWKPEKDCPQKITPEYLLAVKACNLAREETDIKLDLHWHVFQECLGPEADVDLWEGSIPIICGGEESRALSPSDQLLHICSHAMEWNAVAPMRWVADASAVIATTPDFDWARLLAQARKRNLTLVLQYMLPYLNELVDAPIPGLVLKQLRSLPVASMERDWIKVRTRGVSNLTTRDLFRVRYGLYKRSAFRRRFRPAFLGFPRYMQWIWGIDHWWEFPLRGIRTIWKRIALEFAAR